MPCPAVPTVGHRAAGDGVEAPTPSTCTGAVINGAVATGIIPWTSLGVSDENATDGYYNRYTYQVTSTATNTNAQTIAGLKGARSIHSATPTALGLPAAGNQTNDCTPAGGNYNPCSAVAVIVSHGANAFGAYDRDGTQRALPTAADELANASNVSLFVIKDYSDNAANPFDDILLPLSTSDLITPLTAHGTLQDYRAKINDDFSNIKNAVIANAIASRIGASSPYSYPIPAALPLLPPNTLNDPWGTAYTYVKNSVIPNITSASIGSDVAFTMTSLGSDSVAGGNDDIQSIVFVNQLQDAFAKVGW